MSTTITEPTTPIENFELKNGKLPLTHLKIENFRVFKHLEIPEISRVNLITGKNNIGKTGLLEAIWLLAERGHPDSIRKIIRSRGEYKFLNKDSALDNSYDLTKLSFLFSVVCGTPAPADRPGLLLLCRMETGWLYATTEDRRPGGVP